MKGVTFDVSVPRFLLARSVGRVLDSAVFGALSGLRLRDVAEPDLPGGRWARLRVLACGVCGTDLANVTYSASPALEPFASFPAVLGHEILGRVEEVGPEVEGVRPGDRVAVDPMLSCEVRGYEPASSCRSCRRGNHSTCEMAGEEGPLELNGSRVARGLTLGYHRDLPGGWGERVVAHETQLFPLPDEMDERTGVLMEPLSIGMHAVLRSRPLVPGPVLVIGSGPIALGTVWALRAVGYEGELVAQTKRPHEGRMARRLGASGVVSPGHEARQALVDTGSMAYQPLLGPEVFSGGGFPMVFDCVGNEGSLSQALRYTAPRGRIVLLGCAAELRKLDLTFLWARELRVHGFVGYGEEEWEGRRMHTFEVTRSLLLETGAPVGEMVTHAFPLEEVRDALSAAANHGTSEAIKVVLRPEG